MSVLLGRETDGIEAALRGQSPGFALVSFSTRIARDCALGVTRDPLPEWPSHALVFSGGDDIPRAASRRLANHAEWIVPPPADEIASARRQTE